MKLYYTDRYVLPLPAGHRFPMPKYARLRERATALAPDRLALPEAACDDDLARVHERGYIDAVASGTLDDVAQRRIGFPWSPEMVERSRRSVGAALAAAREALAGGGAPHAVSANLAGGTHHAFSDRGEGYCVLNDVAVAARALQRDGAIDRATVVDCDVHQGNGTAAIFRNDPSVFTFSIHGAKNFPFRKETSDLDVTTVDSLSDLVRRLADGGAETWLAQVKGSVRDRMRRTGLVSAIGEPHVYLSLPAAVAAYRAMTGVDSVTAGAERVLGDPEAAQAP
jgi:acetoin utilization deacetylase AcuC-like enzyme